MRIQKANGTDERTILIGMIVDTLVCGRIAEKWERKLFRGKYANIIGSWCVKYNSKYGKAPGKSIEGLYRAWERKTKDKETVKTISKFLSSLSDEYAQLKKDINPQYVLDRAGDYFSQVRIERLKDDLEMDLVSNNTSKSIERLSLFHPMKMGRGENIEIFNEKNAWKEALTEQADGIVKYRGVLGEFIGSQLGRDCFVGFMGPEGRGKSFCLMDVAFRAALQRRRVAFFEAGDMSQNQILRRLATRITNRPLTPCTIKYPTAIRKLKDDKIAVDSEDRSFAQKLDWRDVVRANKRLRREKIRSQDPYFRLQCHPNSTLHVNHIESSLRDWAREGWVADVVVIDYADILDMSYPRMDGREKIDKVWRELRRVSQAFHCLVVTATQTNRQSYDVKTITRKHSSEDKRKLAHVTGMLGINQTEDEKKQEIMRFNWIKVRDAKYLESKCVAMAGCLKVANIAIRSVM
jgi:hypothetical protein